MDGVGSQVDAVSYDGHGAAHIALIPAAGIDGRRGHAFAENHCYITGDIIITCVTAVEFLADGSIAQFKVHIAFHVAVVGRCQPVHRSTGECNLYIIGNTAGITTAIDRRPSTGLNNQFRLVDGFGSVELTCATHNGNILTSDQRCHYIFANGQLVAFTAQIVTGVGVAGFNGDVIEGGITAHAVPSAGVGGLGIRQQQSAAGDPQRIGMRGKGLPGAQIVGAHDPDGAGRAGRGIGYQNIQLLLCLRKGCHSGRLGIALVFVIAVCTIQIHRVLGKAIAHIQNGIHAGLFGFSGRKTHQIFAQRQVGDLGGADGEGNILAVGCVTVLIGLGCIQTGNAAGAADRGDLLDNQTGGGIRCDVIIDKAGFIQIMDIAVNGEPAAGAGYQTPEHQTVFHGSGNIRLHEGAQNIAHYLIFAEYISAVAESDGQFIAQGHIGDAAGGDRAGILLQIDHSAGGNEGIFDIVPIHQHQNVVNIVITGGDHIGGGIGTGSGYFPHMRHDGLIHDFTALVHMDGGVGPAFIRQLFHLQDQLIRFVIGLTQIDDPLPLSMDHAADGIGIVCDILHHRLHAGYLADHTAVIAFGAVANAVGLHQNEHITLQRAVAAGAGGAAVGCHQTGIVAVIQTVLFQLSQNRCRQGTVSFLKFYAVMGGKAEADHGIVILNIAAHGRCQKFVAVKDHFRIEQVVYPQVSFGFRVVSSHQVLVQLGAVVQVAGVIVGSIGAVPGDQHQIDLIEDLLAQRAVQPLQDAQSSFAGGRLRAVDMGPVENGGLAVIHQSRCLFQSSSTGQIGFGDHNGINGEIVGGGMTCIVNIQIVIFIVQLIDEGFHLILRGHLVSGAFLGKVGGGKKIRIFRPLGRIVVTDGGLNLVGVKLDVGGLLPAFAGQLRRGYLQNGLHLRLCAADVEVLLDLITTGAGCYIMIVAGHIFKVIVIAFAGNGPGGGHSGATFFGNALIEGHRDAVFGHKDQTYKVVLRAGAAYGPLTVHAQNAGSRVKPYTGVGRGIYIQMIGKNLTGNSTIHSAGHGIGGQSCLAGECQGAGALDGICHHLTADGQGLFGGNVHSDRIRCVLAGIDPAAVQNHCGGTASGIFTGFLHGGNGAAVQNQSVGTLHRRHGVALNDVIAHLRAFSQRNGNIAVDPAGGLAGAGVDRGDRGIGDRNGQITGDHRLPAAGYNAHNGDPVQRHLGITVYGPGTVSSRVNILPSTGQDRQVHAGAVSVVRAAGQAEIIAAGLHGGHILADGKFMTASGHQGIAVSRVAGKGHIFQRGRTAEINIFLSGDALCAGFGGQCDRNAGGGEIGQGGQGQGA